MCAPLNDMLWAVSGRPSINVIFIRPQIQTTWIMMESDSSFFLLLSLCDCNQNDATLKPWQVLTDIRLNPEKKKFAPITADPRVYVYGVAPRNSYDTKHVSSASHIWLCCWIKMIQPSYIINPSGCKSASFFIYLFSVAMMSHAAAYCLFNPHFITHARIKRFYVILLWQNFSCCVCHWQTI